MASSREIISRTITQTPIVTKGEFLNHQRGIASTALKGIEDHGVSHAVAKSYRQFAQTRVLWGVMQFFPHLIAFSAKRRMRWMKTTGNCHFQRCQAPVPL